MPISVYRSLKLEKAKSMTISLQLADNSIKKSKGVIVDVLVKVNKLIFSMNFIILDLEEDSNILTRRALIDVYDEKMIIRVDNE